jgi:predicted ATP-dependent endonuclease of OLD family
LVRENNTGKSSIIQAISWVLKPAALSVKDLHRPDQPVEVVVLEFFEEPLRNYRATASSFMQKGTRVYHCTSFISW